jgi:hypothetical protein
MICHDKKNIVIKSHFGSNWNHSERKDSERKDSERTNSEKDNSECGSLGMVLLVMPKKRKDSDLGNLSNLGNQANLR